MTLLCIKLCTESMHAAREGADAAGAALQIPAGEQKTVRFCYWAFLGFDIAVLFNVFGSLCALCALGPGAGRLPAFFLSACYACAGIPGAWILWYAACPSQCSSISVSLPACLLLRHIAPVQACEGLSLHNICLRMLQKALAVGR